MKVQGFPPLYREGFRLLILGSFPSVKSRQVSFYYGNPQNRFWRTLCGYFGEEVPPTTEQKREFVLRHKIALWDIVQSCEIIGSADAAIRNETVSNLPALLEKSDGAQIFCNGSKSYSLFCEHFPSLAPRASKLPSTSPANPRFREEVWFCELNKVFSPLSSSSEENAQKIVDKCG